MSLGKIRLASARLASLVAACLICVSAADAQLPSVLYTWDNTGNAAPHVENWVKNFGTNTVTLDNSIFGTLTIIETGTAGEDVAISDGGNRIRESSTGSSGGTDLTGLDYLEFDLGHNGSAPINVQFYVQASTGFNFIPLGPDLAVAPGMATYQVPLTGAPGYTADHAVYVRTMGFNARDHQAVGNVTWSLNEVRSGGTPLTTRDLITHTAGTPEGGLQGAIGNFDLAAIQGNDGGQNQSGLSWNSAGSGSLQWTDLGGSNGAAVTWGNGTAWNGNTFNNRTTDLTGYTHVIVTMSATDPLGAGGTVNVQSFFQRNGFQFLAAEGGATRSLPIDGAFHNLTFDLAGLTNMNVVELTGVNLGAHANNLLINVDNIRFVTIPEPGSLALAAFGLAGCFTASRRRR
jgi:hypothetical protein